MKNIPNSTTMNPAIRFLLILCFTLGLSACFGGGGEGDPPSPGDPLTVSSAVLAPNVVALNPASDGLIMVSPGVFSTDVQSSLKADTVFLREGLAFKVSFVDMSPNGRKIIYTEPPALNEVFSDLKMSGWINSKLLYTTNMSNSLSTRVTKFGLTSGTLSTCLSKTPINGLADLNGFGFKLGFDKCKLTTDDSIGVIFNGTVEVTGSLHVDDFDLAAKTFLFTPQITLKPDASLLLGKEMSKDFNELVPVSIPFTVITPAGPIPMTFDIGIQIGVKASGGFEVSTGGTWKFQPWQVGAVAGTFVKNKVPVILSESLTFEPGTIGVDASVTFEPFLALAVGGSIGGNGLSAELARFRLLAGLQADIGAKLLLYGTNACGTFSVSPVAHADFEPAHIRLGEKTLFDTHFTFFKHQWDPIFPERLPGCIYGPTARIDVMPPFAANDIEDASIGLAGLTLSAESSISRDDDPISSYSWSVVGFDFLSGINLESRDSSQVRVIPNGIKPGDVAEILLRVTTIQGKRADKVIKVYGNRTPVANGKISVDGTTATLDASASQDVDGSIILWKWTLSDGRTIRQRAPEKLTVDASTLQRPIEANLIVFDDVGDTSSITVNTIAAAPTEVVATTDNGQVSISWRTDAGITYNLYHASTPGVTKANYSSLPDGMLYVGVTSPYTLTGLMNGKAYYFVVTAANAAGESGESQEVAVTPKIILNDRIIFLSQQDGNWEIYSAGLDGLSPFNITNNLAADRLPSLSFQRDRIAFVSDRDGNNEIYVMMSDGASPTRLTNNFADDVFPMWSPDGKKIAFTSKRDGNYELYVMDANGDKQLRLTNTSADESMPSWSPDSKRIVFVSERDGNEEIYVVNADGTGAAVNLSKNPTSDNIPFFSPDGKWIAFVSNRDGSYDIWIMDANGDGLRRLTPWNNNAVGWFAWSPNGNQIAFDSKTNGNYEIYVINFDGSGLVKLTTNTATDRFASWTWDGRQIVFVSNRNGIDQIWAMNPEGGDLVNVSNTVTGVAPPMASPVYQTGGGCFIATAAYGSYLEPEVVVLRRFRAEHLLTNDIGKLFVKYYYKWSPPVASVIQKHDLLRAITRIVLTPLVYGVKYPGGAGVVVLLVICSLGLRRAFSKGYHRRQVQ